MRTPAPNVPGHCQDIHIRAFANSMFQVSFKTFLASTVEHFVSIIIAYGISYLSHFNTLFEVIQKGGLVLLILGFLGCIAKYFEIIMSNIYCAVVS